MSRTGYRFTSKFYKKEHTTKIHKFVNARYHTIHTNLQMVIYTIIYTQSDPVTINWLANPTKFTLRIPRPKVQNNANFLLNPPPLHQRSFECLNPSGRGWWTWSDCQCAEKFTHFCFTKATRPLWSVGLCLQGWMLFLVTPYFHYNVTRGGIRIFTFKVQATD